MTNLHTLDSNQWQNCVWNR